MSAFGDRVTGELLPALEGEFGQEVDYQPPAGSTQSAVSDVTVMLDSPTGTLITADSAVTYADQTRQLDVAATRITLVEIGGWFTIGGDRWVVREPPQLECGVWTCTLERRIRESSGERRT